uniref:Dynactin subunit 6 n=2 Tax=Ascaris suum TaxID=6253 RepID=F1L1K6_ASCSU
MTAEAKITLAPDAVICTEAILTGTVTIGAGTVVHPAAEIRATNGPIVMAENNNVEELAVIENLNPDGETMFIGRDNVFEVSSMVQAARIGNNNVFGVRCFVGPQTTVTNGCSVGVKCRATMKEVLPENVVIYGETQTRRTASEPPLIQSGQLEYLRKVLPSFHYLAKRTS